VDVARVVLALEEHDVAEEVMHFLDRTGRARVVATASDGRQLAEAVRQLEPDAVVAQPSLLDSGAANGSRVIAIDTAESVRGLRTAIGAGARGYFVWPAERDGLASATARGGLRAEPATRRATVVAVQGARGGAGATFVGTHLAAAFARRGAECVLIDADHGYGDVATALGAYDALDESAARTFADVEPLIDELDAGRLREMLWKHGAGFEVLLAPQEPDAVPADAFRRAVDLAAGAVDVVVLHLPRAIDVVTADACAAADRVVLVLTLDVGSFRAAARVIGSIGGDRVQLIVNRASRAEVTPADVERVFGRAPLAVLPADRAVPRAQDHGALLAPRSRLARALDRAAARLVEEVAA